MWDRAGSREDRRPRHPTLVEDRLDTLYVKMEKIEEKHERENSKLQELIEGKVASAVWTNLQEVTEAPLHAGHQAVDPHAGYLLYLHTTLQLPV